MNQKVLITGSGGQLGVELVRTFESSGWSVVALDRKALDVTDASAVEATVDTQAPGFIINSAAYNQVDGAESEPETAWRHNAFAVRNLAVACRKHSAQLVHFSTDYVFDGEKGSPYLESDPTHPIGAYAVSKLTGEQYAQAYVPDALILRVSGVFGPAGMFTPRSNFPELMLRLAGGTAPVRVVNDFVASPTYAPAIAERTLQMLGAGCTGIFHLGGGEAISWYDYAGMIYEAAGLQPVLEAANETTFKTAARRPKFSALANNKLHEAGINPMPPLREAVVDYFSRRAHTKAHRSS